MNSKILPLLFCGALLLSCHNAKKPGGSRTTLTVGVMSSLDYLPLAVAQENGYFAENGVEVSLRKFYSPNERDAALQSGNLDGTILDYTGGAIQRAGGEKMQFVSQCDATFELFAGATSGIDGLADLKGKNIAVSRNTVIDFCTDAALKQAGIDASEVQKSEINKIPLRLEMLRNAKIDAAMLPDPFASIARKEGNKAIVSMSDLGYKVTGIAFMESAIEEKADAIRKFYIAYNKAIDDLRSKPVESFKSILIDHVGFPESTIHDVRLPQYSHASPPRPSDLEATEKWLKEKQLVTPGFDIRTIVAAGLLP